MNATSADDNRPARSRAANPLAIAVFVVALALGSIVIWLSLAGGTDPVAQAPSPEVVVALPESQGEAEGMAGHADGPVAFHLDPPAEGEEPALQKIGSLPPLAPGQGLSPAPAPGLFEETDAGRLPIIASDGRRAVATYARPHETVTDATGAALPRIAVLVTGLGLNKNFAARATDTLPPEVSLAFTPYALDLDDMVAAARTDGHEVALELPMEPFDYPDNDPGPYTLLTGLPPDANRARLEWLLARASGYFAVVNRQGGRYLSEPAALGATLGELRNRGLGFVDNRTSARSVTAEVAEKSGIDWALADLVIDETKSAAHIERKLSELEDIAATRGTALGVSSALPVTVDTIADWSRYLRDKGFDLVPVSTILASRTES